MLRIVSKNFLRTVKIISTTPKSFVGVKAFTTAKGPRQAADKEEVKEEDTIPADKDFQVGRRRDEMDAAAEGIDLYNSEPIIPDGKAGTRENPIMVSKKAN